jgi:hypothetical protein
MEVSQGPSWGCSAIRKKNINGIESRGSIPDRGRRFLSLHSIQLSVGPTQPPIRLLLGAVYMEVKRPSREAGPSPTFSAEVKNGGVILLLPPCLFMASCAIPVHTLRHPAQVTIVP